MTKLSDVVVTGAGTFETVAIDHTYAGTIVAGKHYLVDMSGASADKTLTLPAGASKAEVKFTVTGNHNNGWRVVVDGYSTEKILWEDTQYDDAKIMYANAWAQFSWDVNDSQWIVTDASSPMTGTFSGSLGISGNLQVNSIKPYSGNVVVFNEEGNDVDLRVEGDTDTYLLFVDGGQSYVGIGLNTSVSGMNSKLQIQSESTGSSNYALRAINSATTELFCVRNDGRIGIGTASPTSETGVKLDVNGGSGGVKMALTGYTYNRKWFLNMDSAGLGIAFTSNQETIKFNENGTIALSSLAGSGSRTVTADASGILSAASDIRLKTLVPAEIPGLNEVMSLQPKAYKWNSDIDKRGDSAAMEIGFIANEVNEVIPSAAPLGSDGYYGLYDRTLIAALVKSVQQQQAQIEVLKAEVAALKAP
jgi:hypothetical protein